MAQVSVYVSHPQGEKVTCFLNGEITEILEVSTPSIVHVKLVQGHKSVTKENKKAIFKSYLMSLSTHGKVVYNQELESPFYAVWEGDIEVNEDCRLSFSLQKFGVHAELVPAEVESFLPGTVQQTEENSDKKIWFQIMLILGVPLFLVSIAAVFHIWSSYLRGTTDMPLLAAVLFSAVFVLADGFVIWRMVQKLR